MSSRLRISVVVLFAFLALSAIASDGSYPDGLRPPLREILAASSPDTLVPVSVVLVDQVSTGELRRARTDLGPDEARRAVLGLLRERARASQTPLLARLGRLELQGRATRIRPLWIGNVVGVDATPEIVREIAARPEVAWVNHNPKVDVSLLMTGQGEECQEPGEGLSLASDGGVAEIECGTDLMRAPEVWNDLGVTGEGAVIAVIDTGVCWYHPDIENQIWVNPGEDLDGDGVVMDPDDLNGSDDDGNGFVDDLIGWDFDIGDNDPNDDSNGHGSHCAGTVAGDGTQGTQSGMAPDAKVMPVRVGVTFADEVDVWNAMQYAADNGADSITMSLGWPHNQNPDRATWRTNCENTIEAGTAMVIAAGNEGQGSEPDNVRTPGDVPRIISVGAVDCSDNAASFTSRGPVTWQDVPPWNDWPYPPGLIKPDVSAPGVSTKSHNFCSGYTNKSGTSMATPHVAGAVALMVSANPGLTHDEIKQVLMDTSVDLGPAGKDNTFGMGRVDAFEAVNAIFGLSLEDVTVIDDDPAYANGDGGVDTGEIVSLAVSLQNQWDDQAATNVRGRLTSLTPGVTVVHDYAWWPDVAPLGSAISLPPHFSVRVEEGCNFNMSFRLDLSYSGRDTRSSFAIQVGSPFERTALDDDFETGQGWTTGGTSATGAFVREDPNGFDDSAGFPVQPEDDVTADPGSLAFVTGNDDGDIPGVDDVDNGDSFLVSPVVDLTNYETATVRYSRWYYAFPSTAPASDYFRAAWSRDGQSWTQLEEVGDAPSGWVLVEKALPATAFGPGFRVRFQLDDPVLDGGGAFDSVVEGVIDEVSVSGTRIECDLFVPPAAQAPHPVGDTLLLRSPGSNVRLDWDAPPVDAGHDPATLYRIYRSDRPEGGFAQDGLSTEPWHVEAGEGGLAGSVYYLVASENGGGTSGEEP